MSWGDFTLKTYIESVDVLHGYIESPIIKDGAHKRRDTKASSGFISSSYMKKHFLFNRKNKQATMALVGDLLKDQIYTVHNVQVNADVDIVRVAIFSSEYVRAMVMGLGCEMMVTWDLNHLPFQCMISST